VLAWVNNTTLCISQVCYTIQGVVLSLYPKTECRPQARNLQTLYSYKIHKFSPELGIEPTPPVPPRLSGLPLSQLSLRRGCVPTQVRICEFYRNIRFLGSVKVHKNWNDRYHKSREYRKHKEKENWIDVNIIHLIIIAFGDNCDP